MKLPSIIILAIAIVAVAAPSGYAASGRIAPELGHSTKSGAGALRPTSVSQADKIKRLEAQLKGLKAKYKARGGSNIALRVQIKALTAEIAWLRTLIPITEPVRPIVPPIVLPPEVECQTSGNNCTPRQACDWWGYDCSLAEALEREAAAAAAAISLSDESANLTATVESGATESSSDNAQAEAPASDSSSTTPVSVTLPTENEWDC